MKTPIKAPTSARTIIVCLLALCMLLPSCRTDSSSEPLPEASETIEQETTSSSEPLPEASETIEQEATSSSEPLPEASETTEQETPVVSSIGIDELKDKLEDGNPIMLVDVRNRDDFLINHIKGAVSIPLDEIPDRYQEIPQDKEVIVYSDCA